MKFASGVQRLIDPCRETVYVPAAFSSSVCNVFLELLYERKIKAKKKNATKRAIIDVLVGNVSARFMTSDQHTKYDYSAFTLTIAHFRSIYQNSNMAPRLSAQIYKFSEILLSGNSHKGFDTKKKKTKYRSLVVSC